MKKLLLLAGISITLSTITVAMVPHKQLLASNSNVPEQIIGVNNLEPAYAQMPRWQLSLMRKSFAGRIPEDMPTLDYLFLEAAFMGDFEGVVAHVKNGANINALCKGNENALHLALTSVPHYSLVFFLLDHAINVNQVDSMTQSTPADFAMYHLAHTYHPSEASHFYKLMVRFLQKDATFYKNPKYAKPEWQEHLKKHPDLHIFFKSLASPAEIPPVTLRSSN